MNMIPLDPVLIVDDEGQFLQSAYFSLKTSGITNVERCDDSRCVLEILDSKKVSVVLLDILMPYITGKELLPQITSKYPGIPVIMLTALNEIETAVECMKAGAFDYLVKPIDKTRLVTTLKRAIEFREMRLENTMLQESLLSDTLIDVTSFSEIITDSCSMKSIFKYIEAIASTPLSMLITGETGSGKELIARSIHNASGRKGAFVAVNVAGLDDSLFSDTLFGHEKGAFTGAENKRAGLIQKATGGTLFLDEIGDLKMESQVKLLRLLEDRSYYQVGADTPLISDARIVVATNCDIMEKFNEGKFRADLFYRLNGHHIRIPPLRKRREDIPLLVNHFFEKASAEMKKKIPRIPEELFTLLNVYHFPGNIRELKGMVYDAVSRYQSGILSLDTFREHLEYCTGIPSVVSTSAVETATTATQKVRFFDQLPTLHEVEDLLVQEALSRSSGNQSIAASLLGLTRSALNKRINKK
jgi:DNA-binding NtrC family response regulator